MNENQRRFIRKQRIFEISIGIILVALGVSQLLRSYAINNTIKQLAGLAGQNQIRIQHYSLNIFLLNFSVWFNFAINVFMIIVGVLLISDRFLPKTVAKAWTA